MQRERGGDNSIRPGSTFDNFGGFGGFGSQRNMISSIFGGRDPFDDPFFSRPFGSMFGSNMFNSTTSHDSPRISRGMGPVSGPVIEELNTDDEGEDQGKEEGDDTGAGEKKDKAGRNIESNQSPLVEHPDDQDDARKSKDVAYRIDHSKVEGLQPQTRGASYQRVTYGGVNGSYYSATMTRRTGSDGVALEESKQADRTTGQATHRISRGIHEKGHSLTRNLNSDGKVDTVQTLHNLDEDELAGFEQTWKGNADRHLPGWNDGFDFRGNVGASSSGLGRQRTWGGLALPFTDQFGRSGRTGPDNNARAYSSAEKPKKVVRINIE